MSYDEWRGKYIEKETAANKDTVPVSADGANASRSLKSIGKPHYAVVQVVLANAPNSKAAQVWTKFEKDIKIGDANAKGQAYHKKGLLYFDIDEAAKGDVINKPYQILFHEGAHNIDFLASEKGKYFSEIYKNGALIMATEEDVQRLTTDFKSYENLCRELKKYGRIERASLSDILSGYTNNKFNLGIGHSTQYWIKGGDAIKSRETFADFFDAATANAPAYKLLLKYLPKANIIFEEILDELLKRKR